MEPATPFLQAVAQAYASRFTPAQLEHFCFVLPTRRSMAFMASYLSKATNSPAIGPDMLTLAQLAERLAGRAPVRQPDDLFLLHAVHRTLQPGISFDKFRFWGQTILEDFNDIDSSLADASSLLDNALHYREIATDYLTEQQRRVIELYWPGSLHGRFGVAAEEADYRGRMWRHMAGNDASGNAEKKFRQLWQLLTPLYDGFHAGLEKRGLASKGMMERLAVKALNDDAVVAALPWQRIVFVGFADLSIAQLHIMRTLRDAGRAWFHWDTALPLLRLPERVIDDFILAYARDFNSGIEIEQEPLGGPKISIVGSPSKAAQSRLAVEQLSRWADEGEIRNPANAVDTAIIIPDTELLLTTVSAIPDRFRRLNITMGLPMRHTPVAALMHAIFKIQRRRVSRRGESCYFTEDVRALVSNSLFSSIAGETHEALLALLTANRSMFVPASACIEAAGADGLGRIFEPLPGWNNNSTPHESGKRIAAYVDLLAAHLPPGREGTLSRLLLEAYLNSLDSLISAVDRYGVNMTDTTFMQLFEGSVASTGIRFEGRPLSGLQVMGMLETRALDFTNIIMLSMNERVFPGRHNKPSFIPETVRRAYGLPSREQREAVEAYYFHRLLARASNVTLVYDARTVGVRSSEMSRYLLQLLFFAGKAGMGTAKASMRSFRPAATETGAVVVEKTPRIMELLSRYVEQPDKPRPATPASLSASAVNLYIDCPLAFYMRYVEGFNIDVDAPTDYVDASTYGKIVHDTFHELYENLRSRNGEADVTRAQLEALASKGCLDVDKALQKAFNKNFRHLPPELQATEPLTGEAALMASVMTTMIRRVLTLEAHQAAPFVYLQGEKRQNASLSLADGRKVRFSMYIDRLDRKDGRLRIIDYKTGSDATEFADIEALFKRDAAGKRPKAILQLLLYGRLYRLSTGYDGEVQPLIYKMSDLHSAEPSLSPILLKKEPLLSDKDVAEGFNKKFDSLLEEIFNPAVPFAQPEKSAHCKFCALRTICNRLDSDF